MTIASLFTVADYAAAIRGLFPRGRAWSTDPSGVQTAVIGVLAPTPQRVDAAAQALLVDAFPATAVDLLVEWEETLGLSASDAGDSTATRETNVVNKLIAVGGQSQADFIAYAATLGFTITIKTYAPSRCGLSGCGDMIGGEEWCFAWSVAVSANTGALTNAQLLADLQGIAPAETVVFLTS